MLLMCRLLSEVELQDFEEMQTAWDAGADLVVLGTVLEKSLNFNSLNPS